jgi:hypothetical protein
MDDFKAIEPTSFARNRITDVSSSPGLEGLLDNPARFLHIAPT